MSKSVLLKFPCGDVVLPAWLSTAGGLLKNRDFCPLVPG